MIAVVSPFWSWTAVIVSICVVVIVAYRVVPMLGFPRDWEVDDDGWPEFTDPRGPRRLPNGDATDMFLSPWHPSMVGHHDALRAHLALKLIAGDCRLYWGDVTCVTMAWAAEIDTPPFGGMEWTAEKRARRRDPRSWCAQCIARQGLGPQPTTKED